MLCCTQNPTKNGPTPIKKHLSNQKPNLHRFWSQLGSILARFWEPCWDQLGTKSLQKSVHKMVRKIITIWMASGSTFDRFWAPTWRPKMCGFRSKWGVGIKHHPFLCRSAVILVPFGAQDDPRIPPGPPQDPLKSEFSMILDPNRVDFGALLGRHTTDTHTKRERQTSRVVRVGGETRIA